MAEKQRILIIDDNQALVLAAELVLQKAGFDVITASSGPDGLAKARAEKPDLIILDIVMPDMDGYEVCRQLKNDPVTAGIQVIFLSAKGDVDRSKGSSIGLEEVFDGFESGASNFLTKPVTANQLLDAVRSELAFTTWLDEDQTS